MTEPTRAPAEWITRLKRQYGAPEPFGGDAPDGQGDATDHVTAYSTPDYDRDDRAEVDDDEYPDDEADTSRADDHDDDDDDDDGGPAADNPSGLGDGADLRVVDLNEDDGAEGGHSSGSGESANGHGHRRRFNPWVAGGFGAAAVVATIVTLVIGTATSRDPAPTPPTPSAVARPAPPPPPSQKPGTVDGPLRFTATSPCEKLPGSTPAQLLADPNSDAPFVCATDTPGEYLTLVLDRPARITAVAIEPGAILKGNSANQADPWPQYRVVKRLQWGFNDAANTTRPQDTQLTHGEVRMPMPSILATVVTVLIQETARPPRIAATTNGVPTPAPGDFLGPILGGGSGLPATNDQVQPQDDGRPDPSDGKFAISSIRLIGHEV